MRDSDTSSAIVPNCGFRIIGLSRATLRDLQDGILRGIAFRQRDYFKDPSRVVVTMPVDGATTPGFLQAITSAEDADAQHDFFVSIATESQSLVVEVPQFVLDLHRAVGGKVHFSFTCVTA